MGILQARIMEWVVTSSFRGSSQSRDRTQVSHIAGRFFTIWATREAQEYWRWKPIPSPWDLPTQELNRGLLRCRQILYQLSYQGSPNTQYATLGGKRIAASRVAGKNSTTELKGLIKMSSMILELQCIKLDCHHKSLSEWLLHFSTPSNAGNLSREMRKRSRLYYCIEGQELLIRVKSQLLGWLPTQVEVEKYERWFHKVEERLLETHYYTFGVVWYLYSHIKISKIIHDLCFFLS